MALVFVDGCDIYSATSDIPNRWNSGTSWTYTSTGGRGGGGGLTITGTGTALQTPTNYITVQDTVLGFWCKISTTPSTDTTFYGIKGSSGWVSALRVTTSGTLAMYREGTSLMFTGSINVCDNSWHWIESRHSSTNMDLYVDGTYEGGPSSSSSGRAATWAEFDGISGLTITIDDIVAYDSTGSSLLPSSSYPLNALEITTLRPTSDSTVQFTPSSGTTNYNLIDETAASTADYVEDGTSGDQDLYGYGNLGFTPATVYAAWQTSMLENPGAGSINYQQLVKSSTTQSASTSTLTPSSANYASVAWYTDPNTAAAWTGSGIDAALFGIKVV